MKLSNTRYGTFRKNELGLSSSPKTEYLTERLVKQLKKIGFTEIQREKMIKLENHHYTFKDVFAIDEDGDTWGFEIKTHIGDITHSSYGKECHSCNYNFFVVSPDCYYHITKYLQDNGYDHVGVIVGNRYWLDVMKEANEFNS